MISKRGLICILLVAIAWPLFAQVKELQRTNYKGEDYWVYPHLQDTAYLNVSYRDWWNENGKTDTFPRDGKWLARYLQDTNRIASIFEVDSGLITNSVNYDFEGFKDCLYEFKHGKKNGFCRYWNQAGLLTLEDQHRDGRPYGQWKTWFGNGHIRSLENYNSGGEKDGVQGRYFENGQCRKEEFFKEGSKDSTTTVWYENGQIKYTLTYKNDSCLENLSHRIFYEDGSIAAIGKITNGHKIGLWTFYYPNGKMKAMGTYGSFIFHHEHGDMLVQVRIDDWKFWYPGGQLMARGNYVKEKELYPDAIPTRPVRRHNWAFYDLQGRKVNEKILMDKNINIEKDFIEDRVED